MTFLVSLKDDRWLDLTLQALRDDGYGVVTGVLSEEFVDRTRSALRRARDGIVAEIGEDRLRAAGEIGTLRLLLRYDRHFFDFLQLEPVLRVVDATLGDTAILHLQNGFILPSCATVASPAVFQNTFHRDFPRYLNGYLASINVFFAIDEFTESNGSTLFVPGSHQRGELPDPDYMQRASVPAVAPSGSMVIFDSTIWHAAGQNSSGRDRLAMNHQFTRSFIKQQIDYVRALGDDVVLSLPPRTQQLLGYYTRVVTNLDEYYQPEDRRLYRRHQG